MAGGGKPAEDGEVRVPARDGWQLAGTLFRPGVPPQMGAVIIAPAMGVRRGFYARFASFLRKQGFVVLTFDYRGTGGSIDAARPGPALHDWGELDLSGAIDWLGTASGLPVSLVAHSVSAQLLGLADNKAVIRRAVLVAPQSGYWKLWDGGHRLLIAAAWHVVPLLTRLFGRLPGWAYGGGDLPAGVAEEWARWGRHPDYILSYRPGMRAAFAELTAPLLIYGIANDRFAPPRAVDAIASWYSGAQRRRRLLAPDAANPAPIGHFDFFDRRFMTTLWREAANWLNAAGPLPEAAADAAADAGRSPDTIG